MRFWQDAQRLKSVAESELPTTCKSIYNKYFKSGHGINVKASTSEKVTAAVEAEQWSPQMFAAAEKEIFYLMKSDSYPRFLASEVYKARLSNGRPVEALAKQKSSKVSKAKSPPNKESGVAKGRAKKLKKGGTMSPGSKPKRKLFGRTKKMRKTGNNLNTTSQIPELTPASLASTAPHSPVTTEEQATSNSLALFRVHLVLGKEMHR